MGRRRGRGKVEEGRKRVARRGGPTKFADFYVFQGTDLTSEVRCGNGRLAVLAL